MGAAIYSKEALVAGMKLLDAIRKDGECWKRYGVSVQDIDETRDFLNDHLDTEGVLDATELYLAVK